MNKRRGILLIAALAFLGGTLIFLYWREALLKSKSFEWQKFGSTFFQADWKWLSLALGLVIVTYAGRALRWQVMLRPIHANVSFWNIFSATAIGFAAVVLFGRTGELVRPYLIAMKEK